MAIALGSAQPAFAGDTDPLFINLTTDDSHRANMGITFGRNQLDRGPGVKIGNPDLTGAAVFKDNTKSLTW